MKAYFEDKSNIIKVVCLYFTAVFAIACPIAGIYTGELGELFSDFIKILLTPCPLVTDYFALGSLGSAFLNAAICGGIFTALMYILKINANSMTLGGYLLVIAHCFYGLNALNMLPPIFGLIVFCLVTKKTFKENFTSAMFITAFGPFVSELLFRYTLMGDFTHGEVTVTALGVILTIVFCLIIGFTVPVLLPAANRLHKGFNLYNAGLAFGLMGFLLFSVMYETMGVSVPEHFNHISEVYTAFGNSYSVFITILLVTAFLILGSFGLYLNGGFKGYKAVLKESGYQTDILENHSSGLTLINIAIYGLMMLAYFDIVISITDGAGYTGATLGVTFAAITWAARGQHPKNVWPILLGYAVLSLFVTLIYAAYAKEVPFTLSTQCYMNGAAFATGLCPITGRYGKRAGVFAGVVCAAMCASTSELHGGLMLYNGGFTAGITALLTVPLLEFYCKKKNKA